jgi:hypothetical protein
MKYRQTVVLFSAILLLAGCTLWREHEVSSFKDATGGEGLERSFWKEAKAKRWSTIEAHLSSNYIVVTPEDGRLDRDAAVARLQQLQLEEFSLGDVQTELNTDTLVVTYTITMKGTSAGQPLPANAVRMMTVWQKQSSGWMAIVHSVLGPQNPTSQPPNPQSSAQPAPVPENK